MRIQGVGEEDCREEGEGNAVIGGNAVHVALGGVAQGPTPCLSLPVPTRRPGKQIVFPILSPGREPLSPEHPAWKPTLYGSH